MSKCYESSALALNQIPYWVWSIIFASYKGHVLKFKPKGTKSKRRLHIYSINVIDSMCHFDNNKSTPVIIQSYGYFQYWWMERDNIKSIYPSIHPSIYLTQEIPLLFVVGKISPTRLCEAAICATWNLPLVSSF